MVFFTHPLLNQGASLTWAYRPRRPGTAVPEKSPAAPVSPPHCLTPPVPLGAGAGSFPSS